MNPEHVLDMLRADPHAAITAVRQFRVAYPWVNQPSEKRAYRLRVTWGEPSIQMVVYFAWEIRWGVREHGWYIDALTSSYNTLEAAKAAADAKLREQGFVLL